jgi:DNA modification methylase
LKPYHEQPGLRIYHGHAPEVLRKLAEKSVNTVVNSPPYWGLRDYGIQPSIWGGDANCNHDFGQEIVDRSRATPGVNGSGLTGDDQYQATAMRFEMRSAFCNKCGAWRGCFGLEPTPDLYVQHAVEIYREVRRVLKDDGTLWLNLGDSYATGAGKVGEHAGGGAQGRAFREKYWGKHGEIGLPQMTQPNRMPIPGLKPKDLVGIPWRVALALQADGWYLRSDIIWSKPNPMPESITDRPTKSHEYLFLLSKSEKYYFNADAIAEPAVADHPAGNKTHKHAAAYDAGDERQRTKVGLIAYAARTAGKHSKAAKQSAGRRMAENTAAARAEGAPHENPFGETRNARTVWTIDDERALADWLATQPDGVKLLEQFAAESRNAGDVWSIATRAYSAAHFAVFPPALPRRCIKAGCPAGGVVLDCFHGSGTTGQEALEQGCSYIGIEANVAYIEMSKDRVRQNLLFVAEGAA